ncbi:MAG: dNTP triphosphohydrolase [Oscillospiraceae bacterium]|nr:dNTP triphosphohydrolase [Oscillospiraceae bacterium]
MEWNKLLTVKTITEREKYPYGQGYRISPFEEDYQNLVSSFAFRRLQDKTQVFPLDKSDFVRTRLTHSIETSSIAHQLGYAFFTKLSEIKYDENGNIIENKYGIDEDIRNNTRQILRCAGLLHDLGNPPFGHFGEVVIGDFFKKFFDKNNPKYTEQLSEEERLDFEYFNGNAQNIRLIAKYEQEEGLNFTLPTIHTLLKYPYGSKEAKNKSKRDKFGFFQSEKDFINNIASELGTLGNDKISRHPLTLILEAADDIAYLTADLEDAYEKCLFSKSELTNFCKNEIEKLYKEHNCSKLDQKTKPIELLDSLFDPSDPDETLEFGAWIKKARYWLSYVVQYQFEKKYQEIMDGSYNEDLFYYTNHFITIKAFRNAMKKFVYSHQSILRTELSAKTILTSLLEKFANAVLTHDKEGSSDYDKKLYNLMPENCKNNSDNSTYSRLLTVTDFISGMTDSYAKSLYQELNGII